MRSRRGIDQFVQGAVPNLSVIFPLYRCGDAFAELVNRTATTLRARGLSFEIIAVDDACPSGSGAAATMVAEQSPEVRVLRLEKNEGQQRAVFHGLLQARGNYVAVLDADLQDAPEDLGRLLDVIMLGEHHAVFAGRRGQYQRASRMLTSRVFKSLLARLLHVPSDAGSYVVMTRRMADRIICYRGEHPYLLALVGGAGLAVTSIPVQRQARPQGRSAYSALGRIRFAWRAWQTAFQLRQGIPSDD